VYYIKKSLYLTEFLSKLQNNKNKVLVVPQLSLIPVPILEQVSTRLLCMSILRRWQNRYDNQLQMSSVIIFLFKISMCLPGVATSMCTPRFTTSMARVTSTDLYNHLQMSSVIIFLFNMSMSLPGVATSMCTPRFTTSMASLVGTPPMARHVRRSGRPWNRKPY
jgi:predicted ABC-type sugar transport system permease subunit